MTAAIADQDWRERAACKGMDTDSFYPDEEGRSTAEAKAACDRCLVRSECLLDALDRNEPFGMWGGLTFAQRRNLRRRQKKAEAS